MKGSLAGIAALIAALTVLENIDAAVAKAVAASPSRIFIHQHLYGPDEMAHTDGSGISFNVASSRMRTLLSAVLRTDDLSAFAALVDLVIHEKAHVSLASYTPRMNAEHGSSFYRRKEWIRHTFLYALSQGHIPDPIQSLATARQGLESTEFPSPEALAAHHRRP